MRGDCPKNRHAFDDVWEVCTKRLDEDTSVKTSDGELHRLVDLPPQTPILCPVHFDKKASAFTLRSKDGVPGVHCVVCASTFFISAYIPRYDFNYDLDHLNRLTKEQHETVHDEKFYSYTTPGVLRLNEPFLVGLKPDTPLVLVVRPISSAPYSGNTRSA